MARNIGSWRLVLLLPALLLFAFAAYEIVQHLAVLDRADNATKPFPPTMYGEHSGMAVASFALALAFVVAALRRR